MKLRIFICSIIYRRSCALARHDLRATVLLLLLVIFRVRRAESVLAMEIRFVFRWNLEDVFPIERVARSSSFVSGIIDFQLGGLLSSAGIWKMHGVTCKKCMSWFLRNPIKNSI